MTTVNRKKISFRAFISLYVVISFLVISISGIILYITPPGRIANWSNWTFLFLTKHEWQAVHTIFTFLFVTAAAFHIYFNWKPILAYLASKFTSGIKIRKELLASFILSIFILVATLGNVPPFSTVIDFGEDISNSWGKTLSEPPIPHAELLTLKEYSAKTNIPYEEIISNLKNANIEVNDSETTLETIASQNNLTPAQLSKIMLAEKKPKVAISEGGGYGRKTVQDVCEQLDIPLEVGIERLQKNGITADSNSKLKDLANEKNVAPIQIVKLISETIN